MKVKFHEWTCDVVKKQYQDGSNALQLVSDGGQGTQGDTFPGEPIATASVCVADMTVLPLRPDEVAVKDYSENEGMLKALMEAGVVMPPHRILPGGFVTIPICRLTPAAAAL